MAKLVKTYCRIIDYIEAVDSELAQIISDLCVVGSLGWHKNPGTTFLMPQDKAVRDKLKQLAGSGDPADGNKAADMINAMIIRDVFKTPSDWIAHKDDIPNSLHPSQHVEVDRATDKEIIFKSGARATLDTNFQKACRVDNLAVWKLTGEIPVTTDKKASLKYILAKRGKKGKTGGYAPAGNLVSRSQRFKIALAVENTYVISQLQRGDYPRRDVYFEHVMSMIWYALERRKDQAIFVDRILPVLGFDKLDFYILLEPHRETGTYLLDDIFINEWWDAHKEFKLSKIPSLCDTIDRVLTSFEGAADQPKIYSNPNGLLQVIDETRVNLNRTLNTRPREIIGEISAVYAKLETDNAIGSIDNVYPAAIAEYYRSEPGLKMIHDELRYTTNIAFDNLERSPYGFDINAYNELVNLIGECLHASSAEERASSRRLLNEAAMKMQISPQRRADEICIYINSTAYLHFPLSKANAKAYPIRYSITRPDPQNIRIFNLAELQYVRHRRVLSSYSEAPDVPKEIAEAIRSLDLSKLDPALAERVRQFFG